MDAIECFGGTESVRKFIQCIRDHPEIWKSSKEELLKGAFSESFQQVLSTLRLQDEVSVVTARSVWLELVTKSESYEEPLLSELAWLRADCTNNWRRVVGGSCAVAQCPGTENGHQTALFDVPSRDSALWQQWCDAVPCLQQISNEPFKVCALHFHNGAPDETCPVPVLRLSSVSSRKRKATPSDADGTETGSLDRALQAVTDSAFEREMHLLGETDAQQPLKLPSSTTAPPRVLKLPKQDGSSSVESKRCQSGASKGTKVFKLLKPSDNVALCRVEALSNAEEKKHGEESTKNVISQPITLMSVLEQCLHTKETPPQRAVLETPSISSACDKCVHDLPSLRRSLGRIESRVDSMIAIVRTLCARQSSADNKLNACCALRQTGPLKGPPSASSSKPLLAQGGMATLIRVKSGNGSTFKLLRTSPRAVKQSSGDCSPPSLSTKFTRAPKQPDTSLTYLHKAVIRSLLLFQGPLFSIASFRAEGPAVVRTVGEDKLRDCLSQLVNDGLLHPVDDHLDLTHPQASFHKERTPTRLSKLAEYGISKQHYHASLQPS